VQLMTEEALRPALSCKGGIRVPKLSRPRKGFSRHLPIIRTRRKRRQLIPLVYEQLRRLAHHYMELAQTTILRSRAALRPRLRDALGPLRQARLRVLAL
jgi:hypothetical protein